LSIVQSNNDMSTGYTMCQRCWGQSIIEYCTIE